MGFLEYEAYPREKFDTLMPWAGVRRCLLKDDGTVNYYLHPDNSAYKEDGSPADLTGKDGQVMVEIPKFYFKVDSAESIIRWYISSIPRETFVTHPAFFRDRDGDGVAEEVNCRYISAFPGTVKNETYLCSLPGVSPSLGLTNGNYRKYAEARGPGWGIWDFNLYYAVQLLYTLEYGDFDCKTNIGFGVYKQLSNVYVQPTGGTLLFGHKSGAVDPTNAVDASISYRGIEDIWSNFYKFLDGIYFSEGKFIRIGNKNFNSIDSYNTFNVNYYSIPANKGSANYFAVSSGYYSSTIEDVYGDLALGFIPNCFYGGKIGDKAQTTNNFFCTGNLQYANTAYSEGVIVGGREHVTSYPSGSYNSTSSSIYSFKLFSSTNYNLTQAMNMLNIYYAGAGLAY